MASAISVARRKPDFYWSGTRNFAASVVAEDDCTAHGGTPIYNESGIYVYCQLDAVAFAAVVDKKGN